MAPIQQSTTSVALNEELSAACDSSIIEEDVVEVFITVPAQSASSEFKAYLSSLCENHAFYDCAYSELISSKFSDTLRTVEKPERIKSSSAWDIISQYSSLVQPVCRLISCLLSTTVSAEQMFFHLKLVSRENCASMGNNVTDAIIFLRTNKLV